MEGNGIRANPGEYFRKPLWYATFKTGKRWRMCDGKIGKKREEEVLKGGDKGKSQREREKGGIDRNYKRTILKTGNSPRTLYSNQLITYVCLFGISEIYIQYVYYYTLLILFFFTPKRIGRCGYHIPFHDFLGEKRKKKKITAMWKTWNRLEFPS